jgi:hypothetical protein
VELLGEALPCTRQLGSSTVKPSQLPAADSLDCSSLDSESHDPWAEEAVSGALNCPVTGPQQGLVSSSCVGLTGRAWESSASFATSLWCAGRRGCFPHKLLAPIRAASRCRACTILLSLPTGGRGAGLLPATQEGSQPM